MEFFSDLLLGFDKILTPSILLVAVLGCALGMLTGVLPGFGPPAATALLLPLTFILEPTASIVMIAAIYYGTMYGGTITSVLFNVPGEVSSVVTGIDGHAMAKQGQAGKALAIAAIGSFVGGTLAMFGMAFAVRFADLALKLTFIDIFGLSVLALMLVIALAGQSLVKGLISGGIGLFVGTVGLDQFTGSPRYVFGIPDLMAGISYIAVVMGLFGLSEILGSLNAKQPVGTTSTMGSLRLKWQDLRASFGSMLRGTGVGFFFGLLPGSPSAAAAFTSYAVEKRVSKSPERFGHGAIQGVAGPETANNALAISNFIPLLTLGIPSSSTMAMIMGALLINGLQPGPLLFEDHPEVAWGLIASLILSNFILLIMALPMVRMWVSVLRVPSRILSPIILGLMTVGAFVMNSSTFDVAVMWIAGVVGLGFRHFHIPLAPAALTLVLGPMLEENLRRALTLNESLPQTLVVNPVALIAIGLTVLLIVLKTGAGIFQASRSRLATRDRPESSDESPSVRQTLP
ncbi:tripartite tricarboxylate transporter permease [Nocardioides sp. NPDC087217]|uniref:tripartite tricarboxylate transporter permease n=1 Tax=Nocardioides sp. NPDC087217 TaxID=3364335 RepID=UPI0037F705CD